MQKVVHVACNKCGCETSHTVIAAEEQKDEDDDKCLFWYNLYEMLRCNGCNSVTMRHTFLDHDDETPTVRCYPPPSSPWLPPHWVHDHILCPRRVPSLICALIEEIYTAVQHGLYRLAAMGTRAALDSLMIEKVGDHKGFKNNIDAFQKAGYLSIRQAGVLDSLVNAGHAAIHRQWEPTTEDVATLLELTNSVIESVYLHEDRVKALEKNVPARPPPGRRPSE